MTDQTRAQIARKLKTIRLKKHLTQVDVAMKAGISTNYYALVERAHKAPTVETLEKIARALKVKSSEILPF